MEWDGMIIFQRAGSRDEKGNPIIKDFYSSPLYRKWKDP
ncbi:hypothetical protein AB3S75_007602 [Citrus x aurantiifolia]